MAKYFDILEKSIPLLQLANALQHCKDKIYLNTDQDVVVSRIFDPYRSSILAPDHLLTRLAIHLMECCFRLIPHKINRKRIDIMLCSLLNHNNLIKQSHLYNEGSKRIHSVTISGTYCLISVAKYGLRMWFNCYP